jgi:citrate lyase subunit beta/citryl-CoA lyase
MIETMRPRRSVLYVPASNARAMAKLASLAPDCVVFDLEDAVSDSERHGARERLRDWFEQVPQSPFERVIRVNALAHPAGSEDLMAARACVPDAILLPKVNDRADILDLDAALDDTDAPSALGIWAMMETARGFVNAAPIVGLGQNPAARLQALVVGSNDLMKETGISGQNDRQFLVPLLMPIVVAARAAGLGVIDAVYNDFRDEAGFAAECSQGVAMGFDGKSLIHPGQIDVAHRMFSPSQTMIAEAQALVDMFALPENRARNVVSLNGRMVERLHLVAAQKILAKAGIVSTKEAQR